MHDPTEGGLATGIWEMAQASAWAWTWTWTRSPIAPESQALCGAFGLDPLGAIASGALLVALPPAETGRLLAAFEGARHSGSRHRTGNGACRRVECQERRAD